MRFRRDRARLFARAYACGRSSAAGHPESGPQPLSGINTDTEQEAYNAHGSTRDNCPSGHVFPFTIVFFDLRGEQTLRGGERQGVRSDDRAGQLIVFEMNRRVSR